MNKMMRVVKAYYTDDIYKLNLVYNSGFDGV